MLQLAAEAKRRLTATEIELNALSRRLQQARALDSVARHEIVNALMICRSFSKLLDEEAVDADLVVEAMAALKRARAIARGLETPVAVLA